jgi:hypothetical protein
MDKRQQNNQLEEVFLGLFTFSSSLLGLEVCRPLLWKGFETRKYSLRLLWYGFPLHY